MAKKSMTKTPKITQIDEIRDSKGDIIWAATPVQRKFGGLLGLKVTLICIGAMILLVSCFKQRDCEPGAVSYANPDGITNGIQKSSKNDPCASERAARDTAEYKLNYVYKPGVENAVGPAADPWTTPSGNNMYWANFNYVEGVFVPRGTLVDSAERHIVVVEGFWKESDPYPFNDENMRILHGKCVIYVAGYADWLTKDSLLNDCVKVSVPEWEKTPTAICNDKGRWISTSTGKQY